MDGQVQVVLEHPGGQEMVSGTMGRGQYFGEIGLLNNKPRAATIRVTSEGEAALMAVDRQTFEQLLSDSEETQRAMALMTRQRSTINAVMRALAAPVSKGQMPRMDYEFHTFAPGETIFRADDVADCLYYIYSGAVEIVGAEDEVSPPLRLETGQYFGAEDLRAPDSKRTQTIRAAVDRAEPIRLVSIGREKFLHLVHDNQMIVDDIAAALRSHAVAEHKH